MTDSQLRAAHEHRSHPQGEAHRLRALGVGQLRPGAAEAGGLARACRPAKSDCPPPRTSERIHQEAHKAGYAAGYEEGTARARVEALRLHTMLENLEQSLRTLDQSVADTLLDLAIELAQQMVRQELAGQAGAGTRRGARSAAATVPPPRHALSASRGRGRWSRSFLGDQLSHAGHRIFEDDKLARGGCRVEAGGSQIDATMETRWRRITETIGRSGSLDRDRDVTQAPHRDLVPLSARSCQSGRRGGNALSGVSGRLTRINGLVLEATGLKLPLGSGCRIVVPNGQRRGSRGRGILRRQAVHDAYRRHLRRGPRRPGRCRWRRCPSRLRPPQRFGPRRRATDRAKHVPVGDELLGRVRRWLRPAAGRSRAAQHHPVALAAFAGRSTRCSARPSIARWTSACARSTPCSPWGAASGWACSPAPAWARACCSA
ncbi:MAG: FliH/SctL family protein [Comamonadaceae bacterium]|nr:FliH/SctL family protein [Comamonadaceae bacterium]